MADTKAPKGSKKDDKITLPDGTVGRVTGGGHIRLPDGKLYQGPLGDTSAAASPGSSAFPPNGPNVQPGTPTPTTTPTSTVGQTSAGKQFLDGVYSDLQQMVAAGVVDQATADKEFQRRQQETQGLSPALLDEQLRLYNQLKSGQIDVKGFDQGVERAKLNAQTTSPQTTANLTDKSTTSQVANAISDQSKLNTVAGNILTNPNQVNPFGSQTTTIDPITGQPLITQNLSQANQNVLGGVQGNAVNASSVLQGLLGNQYNQFLQGAGPQSGYADQQLQDAIYGRLTQGLDQQKAREAEQLSQTLANRGIPIGSEAYSNAMRDFTTNWDTRFENARNDATVQATNTALQRQQNNVGALGTLQSGFGTLGGLGQSGLYLPQFQGFNATQYQQPNLQELYGTQYAGQLTREGLEAQIEQQKIAAGATTAAAGIAAEASKANAATAANSRPGTSAFTTKPPGS